MKCFAVLFLSLLPLWAQAIEVCEPVAARHEYDCTMQLRQALEQVQP